MSGCDQCWRPDATVVVEDVMPAQPRLGITEPWTFTYQLCRWHKAAWTRWLKRVRKNQRLITEGKQTSESL